MLELHARCQTIENHKGLRASISEARGGGVPIGTTPRRFKHPMCDESAVHGIIHLRKRYKLIQFQWVNNKRGSTPARHRGSLKCTFLRWIHLRCLKRRRPTVCARISFTSMPECSPASNQNSADHQSNGPTHQRVFSRKRLPKERCFHSFSSSCSESSRHDRCNSGLRPQKRNQKRTSPIRSSITDCACRGSPFRTWKSCHQR